MTPDLQTSINAARVAASVALTACLRTKTDLGYFDSASRAADKFSQAVSAVTKNLSGASRDTSGEGDTEYYTVASEIISLIRSVSLALQAVTLLIASRPQKLMAERKAIGAMMKNEEALRDFIVKNQGTPLTKMVMP